MCICVKGHYPVNWLGFGGYDWLDGSGVGGGIVGCIYNFFERGAE